LVDKLIGLHAGLDFDACRGDKEEWTEAYLVVRRRITTTKATKEGAKDSPT
jgi:hypothetical protein